LITLHREANLQEARITQSNVWMTLKNGAKAAGSVVEVGFGSN
jgi:hypothetical protein